MTSSSHRTPFLTIRAEGALLPVDLLQRVVENDRELGGLTPESYHLSGEKLNEAINRSWNRLLGAWAAFSAGREKLPEGDPGTSVTREKWLLPLFDELDYGRLQITRAIDIEGKSYAISHGWGDVPIHLVGCGARLDTRTSGVVGAAKASPHSLVQELLNRSPERTWGFVSNGLRLRVLRDNASLTRQAYLEFDLEAMMNGEVYADFVVLWLVCHQSRVESREQRLENCWLEVWSKAAQERGTRALESLRGGVEKAIEALGKGFIGHPANGSLRSALSSGAVSTLELYRQLLRLVYRLIFLFVAEDRQLLYDPASDAESRERYVRFYSTARLRRMAERVRGSRHADLYAALKLVMDKLGSGGAPELGLPALGGFLFSSSAMRSLVDCELSNAALLDAVRSLAFTLDGRARRAVDYKNLGARELGSVYESLLELHPTVNADAGMFSLAVVSGSERKTTGSFFTPEDLIKVLLDSALDPVIAQALDGARRMANGKWENPKEEAYAYSVVSGIGSVAKGHGTGGENLSADQSLSSARAVRDDVADATGGGFGSSEHRGGLGQNGDEGISTLSADRTGKPAGTGNAPDAESARGVESGSASQAASRNYNDSRQTNPISNEKFGKKDASEWLMASSEWEKTPLAIRYSLLAERSLLNLKVCDPACGSGHFLVAAAHRLARVLAQLQTGEGEPAPEAMRSALRAVISNCIYGVDINPMSVELCKVSLWMDALEPGKPLSFLDAHIQCGDSLVGVAPGVDISEIPDEAFNPAFGDDKATASALKKRNKRERGGGHADKAGQLGFRFDVTVLSSMDDLARWLADRAAQVDAMPEDDSTQVQAKAKAFDDYHNAREYLKERLELDLWTASFFWSIPKSDGESMLAPTQQELIQLRNGGELDARLVEKVRELAERLSFFHWELAFPNVFSGENSGFDCVLGNPPWERIKLQEEEFFASRDPEIATAPNKAARQKLINALEQNNPTLALTFQSAKHIDDSTSKFVRFSERFTLTAIGDVNTYALFAENFRSILSKNGRCGIIVPTGIATDDTTKLFFGDLVLKSAIISLLDFENREAIFPGVHRSYKFSLFTYQIQPVQKSEFVFYALRAEHVKDPQRRFMLSPKEIELLNPNTRTMSIFRTSKDAELTRKIYLNAGGVLINENLSLNPWGVYYMRLVHLSDHSEYLRFPWEDKGDAWNAPLYEAKLFNSYDHRFATFDGCEKKSLISGLPRELELSEKSNPNVAVLPRYFVPKSLEDELFAKYPSYKENWLLVWRDVARATDDRTCISTIIPRTPASVKCPALGFTAVISPSVLLGNLNSIVFDYVVRQKVGGISMSFYVFKQLPVLPPSAYTSADIDFIAPRVLELVYTANDLRPFAEDMGYHGEPFRWDEVRRAQLRAELDAYYARLYGLTRDELRYILDPKEVHGEDFPGETFRVLKDKEVKQFGEYRTRRLVLDAWDKLESGIEMVEEFAQPLEPAIALPAEVAVVYSLPEITWIPVDLTVNQVHLVHPTPIQRQSYAFAWLLVNFGTGRSIPSYDAQKYSYFLQRAGIADLEISYKEFARGPYSPDLKYKAGTYAKNKGFWEVLGNNIARRKNIGKAVNEAEEIFTNVQQARGMVEQLEKMSKDDLGGLATVDFAARKVFEKSQAITPENIRAYFLSDWSGKVNDPWYTDENINRAIELLSELGLFQMK